ncbi:MAG: ABC transporter ATP-binding protein [Bacillota bacterium]
MQEFSLDLRPGDVCGFLGPNGAGKTTTLRMVMGLARPTAGDALLNGHSVTRDRRRALLRVGAIVETPGLFLHMTGRQNLVNLSRLHPNISPERRQDHVDAILEVIGLTDRAADRVSGYSLGMKQRLGIGMALLGEPNLIILDEPTNGLDPFGVRELRLLIQRLREEQGITFLISSHQLSEVEQVCDRFVFIDRGQLVADQTRIELLRRYASLEEAFLKIIQREGA